MITRRQFKKIQEDLKNHGWNEEYTVMCGETPDNRFGTLYTKNGDSFWLNKNTIETIPYLLSVN